MTECPKCLKTIDEATAEQYHGCCSQECDEDEGVMIIIALPAEE